jgi:ABC-type glutathione transport system ATPase component
VQIIQSKDEFKLVLLNMAELSSDLFVETELLKMWIDFFSCRPTLFHLSKRLFASQIPQNLKVVKRRYHFNSRFGKNYSLGRTTVYALRGVDLDVKTGEFLAIVGNSGAGKTTLLNCMAGLDEPDYGVVLFKGKELRKMSDSEKSKVRLARHGIHLPKLRTATSLQYTRER